MNLPRVIPAALLLALSLSADIGPPTVSYTYSGSPGDYTLDFSVVNNTNQPLYFFGVLLSTNNITGSPADFGGGNGTFNPSGYAGASNTTYNNLWSSFDLGMSPGSTLGGFDVTISDQTVPTSVNWIAATQDVGGGPYTGSGSFFNDTENPGFEGVANNAGPTAPEPSYIAVAAGIVGLIGFRKLKLIRQQNR